MSLIDLASIIFSLSDCFLNQIYFCSYVAVAGLPDPREDHAVVMARFARECLAQMSKFNKQSLP